MKTLPQGRHLLSLAKAVQFPASRDEVIHTAHLLEFPDSMVRFLDLFSLDSIFENRVDFINQCEEVKMFIRQEREAPLEYLHSQQD